MATLSCPTCAAPYQPGDLICLDCGANLARVGRRQPPTREEGRAGPPAHQSPQSPQSPQPPQGAPPHPQYPQDPYQPPDPYQPQDRYQPQDPYQPQRPQPEGGQPPYPQQPSPQLDRQPYQPAHPEPGQPGPRPPQPQQGEPWFPQEPPLPPNPHFEPSPQPGRPGPQGRPQPEQPQHPAGPRHQGQGQGQASPDPQREAYPSPQNAYSPPQDAYAPPQDAYAPPRDAYPPPQDVYAPPQDGFPPPRDAYAPPARHQTPEPPGIRREETLVPPDESPPQPSFDATAFMCPHCEAVLSDPSAVQCGNCLRPLRQTTPVLRLVFPGGEVKVSLGQHLVLGRDVGQSPVAATFTQYDNVSRRHSTVWLDPSGTAWVRDERSTNGTFVNGERLPPGVEAPLRDGDTIRLAADATGTVHVS